MIEIPKNLAIQLFAYAREAERSVAFALHGARPVEAASGLLST